MAKASANYRKTIESLKEVVQKKGSTSYSKSDAVALMHARINDLETESTIYSSRGGECRSVKVNPTKELRSCLAKDMERALGLDSADAEKIKDCEFSKATASAMLDTAAIVIKDNLGEVGRSFTLPMTAEDEARMTIQITSVPEKVRNTNKLEQQPDGTYKAVPTGKTVTTSKHNAIKGKNSVPAWLKKSEDI